MVRWEPGAQERLQRAALELFATHGFDGVTVTEIAGAAGLTERTFFRHYADKREVLFAGQEDFEGLFLGGLGLDGLGLDGEGPEGVDDPAAGGGGAGPMARVEGAIAGAASMFVEERRPWSRQRQTVVDSHPALRERELLKLSAVAAAMTRALVEHGTDPTAAALAAETGVTVFRTAFAVWIAEGETRSFLEIQGAVLAGLRTLVSGT